MGICKVIAPKPVDTSQSFHLQLHICFAKWKAVIVKQTPMA